MAGGPDAESFAALRRFTVPEGAMVQALFIEKSYDEPEEISCCRGVARRS
jgi:hypothetical protein